MSNEAKTTKAYKISPELKEKLERLAAESGLETQEAFIEQLAALYELQQLKEGNGSGYAKQIEELEYHLSRPLALFTSMIETESAARLDMSQQHEEKQAVAAGELFAQQQEIADLRKAEKAQAEELARLTRENEQQAKLVEQLEAAARDKGLLVEEYRAKNDTLTGLVNEYKAAADENKDLQTKVNELTRVNIEQAADLMNLEADLQYEKEQAEERLSQLGERHREALERLSERKDTEKERAELAIQKEYQAKLEAAQTEATGKIRELYAQIEQQRKDHELQIREIQKPKDDGNTK